MTFLISGFNGVTLPADFLSAQTNYTHTLPGLKLTVSGNVPTNTGDGGRSFIYGVGTLNDQSYYNLTYVIPEQLEGVPTITFEFEKL